MKKTRLTLLTASLILAFLGASGCGSGANSVKGTYQVTGSSGVSVNITYAPSGVGSSSQVTNQTLPWQVDFNATESEGGYQGSYVFLSAVNDYPNGTNCASAITITIQENGKNFQNPNYVNCGGGAVTLFGYF